jgi:hypothetical protein
MQKKKINIFLFFIAAVLILQLTESYKLILIFIKQGTIVFSFFTIFICTAYIFFNFKLFISFFNFAIFKNWFYLIFILPLFITFIHFMIGNVALDRFIYYSASYFLLPGSVFGATVILFSKIKTVKPIIWFYMVAFLITIVGIYISLYYYDIIRLIMLSSSNTEETALIATQKSRAIGFYGHANKAARSVLSISIVLLGAYFYNNNKLRNSLFIVFFVFIILLTGSRTTLLLSIIFLLIYLPRLFLKKLYNTHNDKRLLKCLNYSLIPIISIVLVVALYFLAGVMDSYGYSDLMSRFTDIISSDSSSGLENDQSVNARVEVIFQYLEKILDSLLIGYGPELRSIYIDEGIFLVASQNQYLEDAFAYGIPYMFFYLFVLTKTYLRLPMAMGIFGNKHVSFFKIFLFLFFIYGFSVNFLLINRITVIILGTFIGVYIANQKYLVVSKRVQESNNDSK